MSATRILRTAVKIGLVTIGALLVVLQLVPYVATTSILAS